jgi:hypothetical protein
VALAPEARPTPASGSTPPPPRDSDELALKKYEDLYRVARDAYSADLQRLEAAEVKATRYVSLLALILGLNAAGFGEFLAKLVMWPRSHAPATAAFLASYVLLSACNGAAFWCFFRTLSVRKVLAPPADESVVGFYREHRYVDVVFAMARRFLEATGRMRQHVDAKLTLVRFGFRWLAAGLLAAVICLSSFTIMKATEDKMPHDDTQPTQSPAPAATTETSSPSAAEPNPAVTAPQFVELERGLPASPDTITKVEKE